MAFRCSRLCVFTFAAVTVASALVVAVGCGSNGTTTTTTGTGGGGGGSSTGWTGGGDGVWRRNAVYAEAATFDPCNAHQPGSGEYHYHDDPICLRYQMNDNIVGTNVGTATATYAESTGTHTHSPILGWAYDGYPVYGPYGYALPTSATSGVRRMVSSFSLRSMTVRQTLPSWASVLQNTSTTLTASQYGPAVSAAYPLGRYIEDYDYVSGAGDLDQYNGRFTVTPEFPAGTYAYFVTIDATGAPAFPYYISGQFNGTASGGSVSSITETTTTYFANNALQSGSSTVALIKSWLTTFSGQNARILDESNLSAGRGDDVEWQYDGDTRRSADDSVFADVGVREYVRAGEPHYGAVVFECGAYAGVSELSEEPECAGTVSVDPRGGRDEVEHRWRTAGALGEWCGDVQHVGFLQLVELGSG